MCRSGGARPTEHHGPQVGGHTGTNQITYDGPRSTPPTGFTHNGPRSTHPTRFIPDKVRAMGFMSNKKVRSCVQPTQPRMCGNVPSGQFGRCGHSTRAKMRECGYVPRAQIGVGIVPKAQIGGVGDGCLKDGDAGGVVEDEVKKVAKDGMSEVDEKDSITGGT